MEPSVDELLSPDIELKPQTEIESGLVDIAHDWITGDQGLKSRLKGCMPVTNDTVFEMARLQAEYARLLIRMAYWNGRSDDVAGRYQLNYGKQGQLYRDIYGSDRNSVVNCLGPKMRGKVEEHLIGPTSVVTFNVLLSQASPELYKNLNPLKIMAPPEIDVKYKTDIILSYTGFKHDGRDLVYFIQLKSDRNGEVKVAQMHEGNVDSNFFGSVTRADAEAMLEAAQYYEQNNDNKEVRCFAVLVPSFDSYVCNNPLGLLDENHARNLVDIFREEAQNSGMLPKDIK